MRRPFGEYQRTLLATLLAFGGVSLLSVCADVSAPVRGNRGQVAFAPSLASASAAALEASSTVIDNVRIIIRATDGTIVLDTVVTFPPGVDELSIAADIPIHGDNERFRATIQLRSGSSVLFEGTQDLDVRAGQSGAPSLIPVQYVGPGANAVGVNLAPDAFELPPAGSSQLIATVRDAVGNVIQNVPLGWRSSNTAVATVTDNGLVTASSIRGTAVITATTLGGVAGASSARVVLPPSQLRVVSGDGQSGRVGDVLPIPLAVELLAADGVGVPNATVAFGTTSTGGSISPATTTTDANGRASATATLGTTVGAFTYSASAAGLTVSINATAVARDANRIAIAGGDGQSSFISTTLPSPLSVRVTDEFGNPGAGRQVNWAAVTGGSLASATTTTDASGFSSNSYALSSVPGAYAVSATLPGGAGVTFSATALPRPAPVISALSGTPQSGPAGSATQLLVVRVSEGGNPVNNAVVSWSVAGTAIIGGPSSITNFSGIASMTATFGPTAGPSIVTASISGGGSTQFVLTSTGPPVSFLSTNAGNGQIVTQFQPLQPLVAHATASNEASVPGATILFAVISGSATPTTFTAVTDANGLAGFTPTAGAAGPNVVRACVMPACTITTDFTFTTIVSGSVWRGNLSSDWNTPGNWSPAGIPGSGSNVYIPANPTNSLALTGGVSMNELFMALGSFTNIGTFQMQIGSKVTTSGAFVFGSGGSFRLTGNAPITGDMPSLFISGTATAGGSTFVSGNVTVEAGGRLDVGVGTMTVSSGFNIDPAGRLTMNNASGSLEIDGDAFFSGQDMGNTDITAGLLDVRGNFTASATGTQAFRANGTHTTRLSGFNTQTLFFSSPGAATSRFQNLEITNASAGGIAMSSSVYVAGTLLQGGRLTVPTSRVFTIVGQLTLQSGSTTTVLGGGSLIFGNCVNQGATATGFTC